MSFLNSIKKLLVRPSAALMISLLSFSSANAQSQGGATTGYLYNIMINTYGTLQAINNLPNYFTNFGQFIQSWMKTDDSTTTSQIQSSFASLGSAFVNDTNTQNSGQTQLIIDLINQSSMNPNPAPKSQTQAIAQIIAQVPNLNELSYSTLVGAPPAPKVMASSSAYNYIKNAGGITLSHIIPGLNWQGAQKDQTKYQSYYNTVMAAESFNGYVLSNQLADSQNGNAVTTLQATLTAQASDSSWIAQIATEELGKVLRQILMYNSQNYVLLTQLVQTQRLALSAQAMTNALLILGNQNTEVLLVSKAQGVKPQP